MAPVELKEASWIWPPEVKPSLRIKFMAVRTSYGISRIGAIASDVLVNLASNVGSYITRTVQY